MTAILGRYKFYFILVLLILISILAWFAVFGHNPDKEPSRGVFVFADINSRAV